MRLFNSFLVLDIIVSDVKSRILGFSLSTAKSQRHNKSGNVSSPTKTRRLQSSANEDNPATILVDGSNVHAISAMDSHPNRFGTHCSFQCKKFA